MANPLPPFPYPSLLGRVLAIVREHRARENAFASYRDLLGADDHLLQDIGVTRDEVRTLQDSLRYQIRIRMAAR